MTRISVDKAAPAVKKFLRSLTINANGVEVILDGHVVCKIVPPNQLTDVEKEARLSDVRRLLAQARHHSKQMPATEVEQRIRGALKTVRKGR